MMSSFRSAAAETPAKPMSKVEPSPPQTTTFVSPRPCSRSAALIPHASAAADANGVRWTATRKALTGQTPVMIVQHEAGITRTVFDFGAAASRAPSTCAMLIAGPQPAQALWPGRSCLSCETTSSSQTAIARPLPGRRPGRDSPFGSPIDRVAARIHRSVAGVTSVPPTPQTKFTAAFASRPSERTSAPSGPSEPNAATRSTIET